ncbi:MAG: hypothetical protein AAF335_00765 [Bacteroidota bacterium]
MNKHLTKLLIASGFSLLHTTALLAVSSGYLSQLQEDQVLREEFKKADEYFYLYALYYKETDETEIPTFSNRNSYLYFLYRGIDEKHFHKEVKGLKIDTINNVLSDLPKHEMLRMDEFDVRLNIKANKYHPLFSHGYCRAIFDTKQGVNLVDDNIIDLIVSFYTSSQTVAFYTTHKKRYDHITKVFKKAVLLWAIEDRKIDFIKQRLLKDDKGLSAYFKRLIEIRYPELLSIILASNIAV